VLVPPVWHRAGERATRTAYRPTERQRRRGVAVV